MRRRLSLMVILCALLMSVPAFPSLSPGGRAPDELSTFSDGRRSAVVQLDPDLPDRSLSLTLPWNATVSSAALDAAPAERSVTVSSSQTALQLSALPLENLTLSGQNLQLGRGSWNWSQSGDELGDDCTLENGTVDEGFRLEHSNPSLSASGGGVWAYRIPLTVTETGGVDRINDTVAFHVDFEAGLESDPRRDVRLTDSSDAEVPVFVWNVSYTGRQCTGADIIFTVPSISALASTTFNLYFSNRYAGAPSYGRQVYIAEGFSSPALSPGWAVSNADGLAYSAGGALRVQGTASSGFWQGISFDNQQPLPADFDVQASIKLGSGSGTGYLAFLTVYQDAQNSVNLGIEYDAGVPGLSPAKFILGRTVAGATSVDFTADAGSAGASHLFRGVCSSGTFTAYVDGTALGSVAVSLQGPRLRLLASARAAGDSLDATFDRVIASTGYSSLSLSEATLVAGWSSYGRAGYVPEASLTSPLIENRDRLPYGTVRLDWAPGDRGYHIDVLGPDNETLAGWLHHGDPVDVSPDEHPAIRLRAVIGSTDPHATPRLLGWRVGTSWSPDLAVDGRNGQNLTMGMDGLQLSRSPERWTKTGTPALSLGVASTFDDAGVSHPCVLYVDGKYWMYYAGYDGQRWRIGLATSPDGSAWTRNPDNPLLVAGSGWESSQVDWPCVIRDDAGFRMWYAGSADNGATFAIGYATSPDGVTWTRYAGNPVLTGGGPGSWNQNGVFAPRYWDYDGRLYFAGKGAASTSIGYATSPDGITWTENTGNPVFAPEPGGWDSMGVVPAGMSLMPGSAGGAWMWYTGFNASSTSVGLAVRNTSSGSWQRAGPSPVLNAGAANAFDRSGAGYPAVVFHGREAVPPDTSPANFSMYYSAQNGTVWRIGSARAGYCASGRMDTGDAIDLGVSPASLRLWTCATAPANTSVTVKVRTAPDDTSPYSAWTNLTGSPAVVPAGRYLQWTSAFSTGKNDSTPVLSRITAEYEYHHGFGKIDLPAVAMLPSQELASVTASAASTGGAASVLSSLDNGTSWQTLPAGAPVAVSGRDLRLTVVLSGNHTATPRLSNLAWSYTYKSFPSGLTLDAGADGSADWFAPGVLTGGKAVEGLAAALDGYLAARRNDTGVSRVITLSLRSATPCAVNLSGLSVHWSPVAFANSPPRIASTPPERARPNELYIYVVAGRDADRRDRLAYTLEEGPERMAISGTTGEITWQPYNEEIGYHPVRVSVTDGKETASQQYTLVVSTSTTNFPPRLSGSPPPTGRVGYEYSCVLNATDPDGDAVVFSLGRSSPAGATMGAATGALSWIPGPAQSGLVPFEVAASDGTDIVRLAFSVNITAEGANSLPVVTSGAPPAARVGQHYQYNLTASDQDGDQPSFGLLSGPANSSLSIAGLFTWTPALSDAGSHNVVVRVSDGKGYIVFNFTVRVGAINRAPAFSGLPPVLSVPAGRAWNFIAQATDADGDRLTYFLVEKPSGMTIDPETGAISWSPKPSLSGKYRVSVAATDGLNTTYLNFTITVKGAAPAEGFFDQYGLVFTLIIVAVLAGGGAAAVASMRRSRPAPPVEPAPAGVPDEGTAAGAAESGPEAALGKPRIIPAGSEPAVRSAPAPPLPPPEPAATGAAEPMKPVGTISKELQAAVEATRPPPAAMEAPAAPPPPPMAPEPAAAPPVAEAPSTAGLQPASAGPPAGAAPKPVIAPPLAPTLLRPPPAPTVRPPAAAPAQPEPGREPPELYKPIPGPYDDRPLGLEEAPRATPPAEEPAPPSTSPGMPATGAIPEDRPPAPPGMSDDMDFIASFLQSREKSRGDKVIDKSSEWGMLKDFKKELESTHDKPREPAPAARAPTAAASPGEKPATKKQDSALTLDDILSELEG
jgi:hypothetical protein